MLYFIPAWYQADTWQENEQNWYVRRTEPESDDTVRQIRLCRAPFQILLPGYAPNLRRFLHRQGIGAVSCWSVFDAVAEVRRKKVRPWSIYDRNWPEEIEFRYTNFAVLAMLHGQKFARIDFGEDGNTIRVERYEEGRVIEQEVYDDRGFLSSRIFFENGEKRYQEYLTEEGLWKLRVFFQDGHAEVNPARPIWRLEEGRDSAESFKKLRYESLDELIAEVLSVRIKETDPNDCFVAAMHARHLSALEQTLAGRKVIASFFGDRYYFTGSNVERSFLARAFYLITDSERNRERVLQALGYDAKNLTVLMPVEIREGENISFQREEQEILLPVDGLEEESFRKIIAVLTGYFKQNPLARVCLLTRETAYGRRELLLEKTRTVLSQGMDPDGGEDKELCEKFSAEQCVEEPDLARCLRTGRVLAELRDDPDPLLQVLALGMGLPQIVWVQSRYARHPCNCLQIVDTDELPQALSWYLDSLDHWNDAQMQAYRLGRALQHEWEGVTEKNG